MRWLKRLLLGLFLLLLVLVILVGGVVVALNTSAGQKFAVQEINKFGKNYVFLGGLSGRFPADLTIPSLQLRDPEGVWLNAEQLRLSWSPLALLHGQLSIQTLSATTISAIRAPSYPSPQTKKSSGGGFALPIDRLNLNQLEIGALHLAPQLAGQAMTMHITGHAEIPNFQHATLALDATTENDLGAYHLNAILGLETVSLKLIVNEKPGGLLSHLLDPSSHQNFTIATTLNGPRERAKLDGTAALGAAKLSLAGFLGLNQASPWADIQVTIPALAPFGALAGQSIKGQTVLHLAAAKQAHGDIINFSAQDALTLTSTPKELEKLLVGQTSLDVSGSAHGKTISLSKLMLEAPGFSLSGAGVLSKDHVDLTAHATLPRVADLMPNLNGHLSLQTQLQGPPHALHADAELGGQITVPDTPSGPFLLTLHADNLPSAPTGTVTGSGSLAGAPLALNAHFAYDAKATSQINLDKLTWRSLTAQAALSLKPNAKLPSGTGQIKITNLSDLNALAQSKLGGMVEAKFAYLNNQDITLTMAAKDVSWGKSLTGLNGHVDANGPPSALEVKIGATLARLLGHSAQAKLAGTLDIPNQNLKLSSLTAGWQDLAAKLQSPAEIDMKPDIAVRHLHLILARADVKVDGTFSPTLNAQASVRNLDLSLLRRFSPDINATGLLALTANITGTAKNPQGHLTVKADDLRYITPTTASLPPASLTGKATLKGQDADIDISLTAGTQARASLRGRAPFSLEKPMNLTLVSQVAAPFLDPFLSSAQLKTTGNLLLNAHLTGTPKAPAGMITFQAQNIRGQGGVAQAMPPADLYARASLKDRSAQLNMTLNAGPDVNLSANGRVPLTLTRPLNLALAGHVDLKLLNPILAANGSLVRGILTPNLQISGTANNPQVNGTLRLASGSILNVTSGLNLTSIDATVTAADKLITLQSLSAVAGGGKITGHGTIDLAGMVMPVNLMLNAHNATPIASDLLTETLNAALTLQGGLKTGTTLAGTVDILKAAINIPHALPPSVAKLPIHYEGEAKSEPKAAPPPAPPINLALNIRAKNQIFIRGDGLFAELGGHLTVGGTVAHPVPNGGFSLIRGNFSLAGKTLQFNKGVIEFNGDGFTPTLDLEATTSTNSGGTATLSVGGTASKPKISLSSSPPLPSDEILAQLLFAQSSESLSPFQAASLAAALAQISGIGGGFSPLDSARNALGLDQLSVGSDGKGGPSVQAGRYVAPGVYVGASQSTTGQGSRANVEINLYKGLKLQSSTGTDSTGQNSSSVGLSYQFNY